jgi:hypothetical protein
VQELAKNDAMTASTSSSDWVVPAGIIAKTHQPGCLRPQGARRLIAPDKASATPDAASPNRHPGGSRGVGAVEGARTYGLPKR